MVATLGLAYGVMMESVEAALVAVAILLAIVLVIGLDVFCLVLLANGARTRLLPKWLWAIAIIGLSPIGAAAYLVSSALPRRSDYPLAPPRLPRARPRSLR
jgi:hypothetical protein